MNIRAAPSLPTELISKAAHQRGPWLRRLSAEGTYTYDRGEPMSAAAYRNRVVEVVRKPAERRAFVP